MLHKTFKAAIGFSTNEAVVQFNYDEQAHTYTAQLVKQSDGEEDDTLHIYVAMYATHTVGHDTLESIANNFCLYFDTIHVKCPNTTWFTEVL